MYLPKIREIKEALTSLFSAPYTTKFPFEPYQAPASFRGRPVYDPPYCVGCGTCAQVCPTKAIAIKDDMRKGKRILTVNYNLCMNCGQCEEKCITQKGIRLNNEYSLAIMDLKDPLAFHSVEKELAVCECCGEAISCRDHLYWVKERLGAKAYAHPNLMLETQRLFSKVDASRPKARIRREDQIKEVCAKCRHKIVVADEF